MLKLASLFATSAHETYEGLCLYFGLVAEEVRLGREQAGDSEAGRKREGYRLEGQGTDRIVLQMALARTLYRETQAWKLTS